jgi:Protein of unknown function (DUF1757)
MTDLLLAKYRKSEYNLEPGEVYPSHPGVVLTAHVASRTTGVAAVLATVLAPAINLYRGKGAFGRSTGRAIAWSTVLGAAAGVGMTVFRASSLDAAGLEDRAFRLVHNTPQVRAQAERRGASAAARRRREIGAARLGPDVRPRAVGSAVGGGCGEVGGACAQNVIDSYQFLGGSAGLILGSVLAGAPIAGAGVGIAVGLAASALELKVLPAAGSDPALVATIRSTREAVTPVLFVERA